MSDADREVALVASDMVVLTLRDDELHVALIRRAAATERGKWALPGGFMRRGESAEQAAYRELREEVGIAERDVVLEQLRTYTDVERDPRPERVISVAWTVFGARLPDLEAASDALEAVWVPVDEALGMPLAFDHQRILADGVERARSKLEYTSVATAFLDDEFTMSQLRHVYQAVWGGLLEPANFHRKVLSVDGFVEETGDSRVGRGRPAKLYRRGSAQTIYPPLTRASVRGARPRS